MCEGTLSLLVSLTMPLNLTGRLSNRERKYAAFAVCVCVFTCDRGYSSERDELMGGGSCRGGGKCMGLHPVSNPSLIPAFHTRESAASTAGGSAEPATQRRTGLERTCLESPGGFESVNVLLVFEAKEKKTPL